MTNKKPQQTALPEAPARAPGVVYQLGLFGDDKPMNQVQYGLWGEGKSFDIPAPKPPKVAKEDPLEARARAEAQRRAVRETAPMFSEDEFSD